MKSWKKRWKEELDAVIPALNEDVISEPIPARERTEAKQVVSLAQPWYTKLFASPRRVASCLSACAVALVAVGASLYLALQLGAPLTASAEVISVEVNPQAVFSVDKKGKVTAVVASNADADVVLSENRDAEMEGKTVEEAVKIFVDYTAQLGYLDLEKPDAVRITSCTKNGKLEEVGDTLETYFREHGLYVAVVEETVDLESFCARANLSLQSNVKELKESVERIPALYFEREAEGKTLKELQALYGNIVTEKGLTEIFVAKGFEKIEERKAAIEEIETKLDEIKEHPDNPGRDEVIPIPKSYWDIKDDENLSDELSALVAATTEKIAAYKIAYGVTIEDVLDIEAEKVYNSIDAVSVLMNAVSQTFENVLDDIKTIGVDISLYYLPASVEAYVSQVGEYAKESFSALSHKYQETYVAVRDVITETQYEDFINGLINEYGSLSEYFYKN